MSESVNISTSFQGKTQAERVLPALSSDTFQVDDRDMADFLAFTVKFSKAFKYINPQNKADGTWQSVLLSDPTLLLAYIMKTDHFMEFSRYLDYANGIQATEDSNTKYLFTQQFFSIGFHIILRINRWYKLANQSLQHHPFRDYLHQIIDEEGREALQNYYLLYFSLCEWIPAFRNESYAKLEDLDRVWMFEPFPCVPPKTCFDACDFIVKKGLSEGQKLFHLQEKIIKAANGFFKASIQTAEVMPHVGLLLTFLDLLKYQQTDLNRLTEAHLDFYYHSILGFRPLPA